MDKSMLRKALWEILRPLIQLMQNLLNPEKGEEWEREFKKFLRKEECWKRHLINCDVRPYIPNRWTVEVHKKGGVIEWDPKNISFYLSEAQKIGRIVGTDLHKELADMPVLNACFLDFLHTNPHLIPEEWKGKAIFFWGTIYCRSSGDLCVRYLYWNGDSWNWSNHWLNGGWHTGHPAAYLQVEN
jgi:hypothetical protein